MSARFAIGEKDFLLDGAPFRILSGALHYFRVHPRQWSDRIAKAAAMGLNTIETYVAWNAHAPTEDMFDLTGGLDLGRFLDLIADAGMHAIVRPGPYICAEWTNGGLPAWLFRDGNAGVRRDDPLFLSAVEDYLRRIGPVLAPRQVDRAGPIILVQVENEYGAYGSDKEYLRKLVKIYRDIGINVPLTTVDQPVERMLDDGGLPELHKTGSFGSRVAERLDTLRKHQPTGPLMCAEFWNGWFDEWGAPHQRTSAEEAARNLDELLSHGASVNIYMFHGGTNFGLSSGANDKGIYRPIVTSYDYDAPLDEAGNPTEKYWAYREVLRPYADVLPEPPAVSEPGPQLDVPFVAHVALWDVADRLGTWTVHERPPTADEIGQYAGLTLYRTELSLDGPCVLDIDEVRDRAQVFLGGQAVGVLERERKDRAIALNAAAATVGLDILVEDLGRVDYGPRLGESKGVVGEVRAGGRPLHGWRVLDIGLADVEPISEALRRSPSFSGSIAGPSFALARFDGPSGADLFLDTAGWGKGIAWVNGFCLGRYWSRGPQRTLYVPAPALHTSGNELVILELHAIGDARVRFVARPDLGSPEE